MHRTTRGDRTIRQLNHLALQKVHSVTESTDLGVIIHDSCRASTQCAAATGKSSRFSYQLRQATRSRDTKAAISICKAVARPQLEYAAHAECTFGLGQANLTKRSVAPRKDDPSTDRPELRREAAAHELLFTLPQTVQRQRHCYLQAAERSIKGSWPDFSL